MLAACTPSPADYNVTVKTKSVGALIPQSERFAVPQSPAVSESGSQVSHGSTPNNKNVSFCRRFHQFNKFKQNKKRNFL